MISYKVGLLLFVFNFYLPPGIAREVFSGAIARKACRLQIEAEEFPSACFAFTASGTAPKVQKGISNEIGLSCLRARNKEEVPLSRIRSYLDMSNIPHMCRRTLKEMKKKREYSRILREGAN